MAWCVHHDGLLELSGHRDVLEYCVHRDAVQLDVQLHDVVLHNDQDHAYQSHESIGNEKAQ